MIKALALLTILAGIAFGADAAAEQKFKLVTNPLVLPPGQTDFVFNILVTASNLPSDSKKNLQPSLQDAGTPASPPVKIDVHFLGSDDPKAKSQLLKFEVKIVGFPASDSQARSFVVTYGDLHESLAYTLTNTPSKGFSWTVKANPEWNLASMPAFPVLIKTNDLPATKLSLFQADFVSDDKLRHTVSLPHFQLSAEPDKIAPVVDPMLPRKNYTVYVHTNGELPYGTLKGNIALLAYEKADPEILAVTIYAPRPYGLILGLLCLALGALTASFLQFFLRPFIRTNEQKQVILVLRKRVSDLKDEFAKLPAHIQTAAKRWSGRAGQLETDLSDGALKHDMAPLIPEAFDSEVKRLETFQTKMEDLGNAFSFLRTLLRDGLETVAALDSAHPGHEKEVDAAAEAIADLPQGDKVGDDIAKALKDLRDAAKIGATVSLAGAPRKAVPVPDEIHRINLQIAAANLAAWILWAGASVLSGAILLILINPAFGTAYDLAVCIAWGMGITAVGAQTSQLTPSTVATSLGVKLPGGK